MEINDIVQNGCLKLKLEVPEVLTDLGSQFELCHMVKILTRNHREPMKSAGTVMTKFSSDSKVHGANIGPSWGRQDPAGPHVGPMNFAIWEFTDV